MEATRFIPRGNWQKLTNQLLVDQFRISQKLKDDEALNAKAWNFRGTGGRPLLPDSANPVTRVSDVMRGRLDLINYKACLAHPLRTSSYL